jgi:hypothetical protein
MLLVNVQVGRHERWPRSFTDWTGLGLLPGQCASGNREVFAITGGVLFYVC